MSILNITEICKRILELDVKASPPEWSADHIYWALRDGLRNADSSIDGSGPDYCDGDTHLIAYYRNHAPTIAKRLIEVEARIKKLVDEALNRYREEEKALASLREEK